jgi:hypothetical protein
MHSAPCTKTSSSPDFPTDLLDLGQRQFPGQVEAHRPLPQPEPGGQAVGDIGLGREVDRQFRGQAPGPQQDAGVRDDQGVHADLPQFQEIGVQARQVVVMGEDIDRHIDLHPMGMGVDHRLAHRFRLEVAGLGTQAELPPR